MRRAFVLPVSAAVVGALLAIGVSAIDRSFDSSHDRIHVIRTVDRVELSEVELGLADMEEQIAEAMEMVEEIEFESEIRVQRDVLREVREQLRSEIRAVAEVELREGMEEAVEQLEETVEMQRDLVEGLTKEDGSAHKRPSGS
jgi:acyl-CoA reductase-like NAD-dependent aldehyde dehydrogenase